MATPSERLAESLAVLKKLQDEGVAAIRSRHLSRTHRERLLRNGFLMEVIKGWYISSRPDETAGDSTFWYASFWSFCASYLESRFDDGWSLSPEQSLSIHARNWTVPRQLLVRAARPGNNITKLPGDTSLFDVGANLPAGKDRVILHGLRLFSLPAALIACPPAIYRQNPTDIRTALAMIGDSSGLLERLLEGGHSTIAGGLAGAFRNIGRQDIADDIAGTMKAAGYLIREKDPFAAASPMIFTQRESSPYVIRARLLWQTMRDVVIAAFPAAPGLAKDKAAYLKQMDDRYVADAYHSLSIEGYRVSAELIERVGAGDWNPDGDDNDRTHRDALAARGYWLSFQAVRGSIAKILDGAVSGTVIRQDHNTWYRELFSPSVTAGILRPGDLTGYRNGPVYIRGSRHAPPNKEAVRDLMPAFFDLLEEETEPGARAVLGHFLFVFIHPYMDGNGRIGRFIMNAMLAAGGYPWTIIPVDTREVYMAALEAASVDQDITPFVRYLGRRAGRTAPLPRP